MATVFLTPCSVLIAGTTSAGKTSLVRRILRYRETLFDTEFTSINFFYGVWQDLYSEMEKEFGNMVQFTEGVPSKEDIQRIGVGRTSKLIILDDMMGIVSSNLNMQDLFTRESHHYNISVVYITQNVFSQGRASRNIALNLHYLILMANPRISQISILAAQLGLGKALTEAFSDATSVRFGYLIVVLSPLNDTGYKMITHVIPDEQSDIVVYQPV